MKEKTKYAGLLALIVCFAMILQSGFVVPVFAAGTYSLSVHYMTGTYNIGGYQYDGIRSDEHPVIIPPGTQDADIIRQFENNTDYGSVNVGDTPSIAEPFRLLGYTFDGWYYDLDFNARDPYASAKKYNGTITAGMANEYNRIDLYAKWSLYNSPDITSNSVSFVLQNEADEYINDPIMWTDSTGAGVSENISFDSAVTDYYGYVYGDVSKLKMSFEQYDPGRVEIQTVDEHEEYVYSYENHAYSTVKFNGSANYEDITSTNIRLADLETGAGIYRASTGMGTGETVLYLDDEQNLVSGMNVETNEYMELKYTQGYVTDSESALPEENIISVTVYMPAYQDEATGHTVQNTKTYNFHIKRLNMILKPAYGNTPFGRIMTTYPDSTSRQKTLKDAFAHNYIYNRFTYTPSAWNIYGDDGKQVVMGSTPGENEYINYDEDETAIVVTEGEEFNDPGISLYINGSAVDSADITRKIHYTTINSLRYPKWHSDDNGAADKTETDTISVGVGAKVSILKDEHYVKPGIYTIDYEYTPAGMTTPIIAHRNMIVLPKQDASRPYRFDINMDNFINALDTLVYDIKPEKDKYIIDNAYLYRVLDVTNYGTVDDADKQLVMAGTTNNTNIRPNVYPSLAVDNNEGKAAEKYTVQAAEESGKAHLYMDFLGTDRDAIVNMTAAEAAEIDKTQKLNKGDVFYIGYRFTGTSNLTDEEQSALLKEITLSTSYDVRYVEPNTSGLTNLKAFFSNYDKQLYDDDGNEIFDIIYATNPYSADSSTAFEKWNNIGDAGDSDKTRIAGYDPAKAGDTSNVRTMRLELYLKDDKSYELKDDEYILKLPMRVVNIPPSGEEYTKYNGSDITRQVLSAKLGAAALNLSLGTSSYGYMWDMSDTLNLSVTYNLRNKLQYMGSYVPAFAEEGEPTVIEAMYKEPLSNNVTVSAGVFEGNLPPGVTYEAGTLKGTPTHAGDYDFYTNGVRYRMHVKKRPITVIAEDKTMTYGDALPTYTYKFNEDELAKADDAGIAAADTLDSDGFTEGLLTPDFTCAATSDAVNGYSEVGSYDINLTLAESANYTFVPQKGTLTINKRPLTVTGISKSVPDYYAAPDAAIDFSTEIKLGDSAIYSESEFAAGSGDIVGDDDIQITYDALFTGWSTEPQCDVTLKNIKLNESYGRGRNYEITTGTEISSTGRILKGQIIDFGFLNDPQLKYTYGDSINLHSGQIYITIRTGEGDNDTNTQGYNFITALSNGIKLELWKGSTKLQDITDESYMPSVAVDNDQSYIRIYCNQVSSTRFDRTGTMSVDPMEITVRADDKERYYGDDNDTSGLRDISDSSKNGQGFTYQIVPNSNGVTGRIIDHNVTHDTQQQVLTDNISYEAADAGTDIRAEDLDSDGRGKTIVPINMTYSGTDVNYDVTVAPAYSEEQTDGSRLEILQRPITIDLLTAPTLKATDYILSDGTKYSPSRVIEGFAVAGKKDGADVTDEDALAVTLVAPALGSGLYNDDPVKFAYNVRYVDDSEGHNYAPPYNNSNITVDYGMDTSFEKSRNYYIKDINAVTGDKEIRRISDIKVIRQPKTGYVFGEEFELKSGEDTDGVDADDYTRSDDDADDTDSWIRITYDTGEVSDITFEDLCEDFADNAEYNDNLDFTIKIGASGTEKVLNKAFMDDFNKNAEDKHFNVADSGNITIALKAKNVIDGDTRETKPNQENYQWEWNLDVERQTVHVSVDDQSTLYDRTTFPTYTCRITETDFRWGQSSSLATGLEYSCLEDDNSTQASATTPAGIYTINLAIPDTANYTFACAPGTLTVRQRPLIVTKIEVPNLSAEAAEKSELTYNTSSTWTSENDGGITFASGYEPLSGETVTIKYTYTYQDNPRSGGDVDVVLSDISLDRLTGNARNYYLQSVETDVTGVVASAYIDHIAISYIRGKNENGDIDEVKTSKYVYGDTLDLSGMVFNIYYSSGGNVDVTDVEDLASYGVKAEFYKKDASENEVKQTVPVKDGVFLTRDYDGMYIKLSLADDNDNFGHHDVTAVDSGNSIAVGKRTIHIRVNDSSYTYGDNPPSNTDVEYSTDTNGKAGVYTYYLYEADFPQTDGKTKADFCNELVAASDYVPPKIYAYTEDGFGPQPDNTTNATDYSDTARKPIRIKADADSASSDNYTFTVTGAHDGILVVNKRKIKATGINRDIVPTLTADIAYQNDNKPPITISVPSPVEVTCQTDGISTGSIDVSNMVKGSNNDKVAFLFDVVYDSVEDTGDDYAEVQVKNFKLTTDYTKYPDCKNYTLDDDDVPTASYGKIITRRISDIIINQSKLPTLNYTYGGLLKIDNGEVIIRYTSGESDSVPMDKLADYNIDILFVDDNGNALTDTLGRVLQNTLLTVKDFNGVRLRVRPGENARVEVEDDADYYAEHYVKTTSPIVVRQKQIRLIADDLTMTYGDNAPELKWHYNENDLVNGDKLTSLRFTVDNTDFDTYDSENHRTGMYAAENGRENGTPVSNTTPAGSYAINWKPVPSDKKNSAANYSIYYVAGNLTVDKKPLKISKVLNVPDLTPAEIAENNTVAPVTVSVKAKYPDLDTYGNDKINFIFEEGYAPLDSDKIEVSYDAVYKTITPGETTVEIKNVNVSTDFGKNKNYIIEEAPSSADGEVIKEAISEIEIISDPVMRDDDMTRPIAYKYADSLNLNRGTVRITYNNGNVTENVRFKDIEAASEGKLSLAYSNDEGYNIIGLDAPENGQTLYVTRHNGRHIKINVPENENITLKYMGTPVEKLQTKAIEVNKVPVTATVRADSYERIYGEENPRFYCEYSGFVNGDDASSENFASGLVEPDIYCEAVLKSPVGEGYRIWAEGGESPNYYFAEHYVDAELEITQRPLDVETITGGIPALTSKIIRDEPGFVHVRKGYALNTAGQVVLGNLSQGDVIRISYDAIYTTIAPDARNITVSIDNVAIEDYGHGSNYYLRYAVGTATGGNVYTKKIAGLDIMTQPRLEYTYGEYIDLAEPGVKIVYDDGEVLTDVPYDRLDDYDVDLYITYKAEDGSDVTELASDLTERQEKFKNGEVTEEQQKLTTDLFTGAYYTLVPRYDDTINSPSLPTAGSIVTGKMTVNKKLVNVNINPATSIYGDDPFEKFTFAYGDDFEYRETAEEVVTTAPDFVCTDESGTTVDKRTEIGTYTIRMTDAAARNYIFHNNNKELNIEPRKLIISTITNGIPDLTAAIIKANMGETHYIPAYADSTQFESDRVNDDDLRVSYDAVYYSEDKDDYYNVGIANMELVDGYGKNKNYTLDKDSSVKVVEGGGRIIDKEITEIEITEQPRLEYTYGETLDLSGGKVHIVYDTGYDDNITFAQLSDYRLTPSYYDEVAAAETGRTYDKDELTVSGHNGKKIKLTARSAHEVEPDYTEPLTVEQRVLVYGDCIAEPIVYDGETTETEGTVIFANMQYNDKVTATATFNFEDCNAGEDKTVYITDIKLDDEWTANYRLSTDETTTTGTINKADAVPSLTLGGIEISDVDNSITITAPEMTETQINGGAKYEYSIDGGETWQESNVFEGLALGQDCDVRIRFAGTDNYNQSDATEPISVKTYKVKLTLVVRDKPAEGEDYRVLRSFYTNVESVEKEENFKELIGEITELDENGETKTVNYYTLYQELEGGSSISFPLAFTDEENPTADVTIYTTLVAPRRGGGGGGGGAGGGSSFFFRYQNEDGSAGSMAPSTINVTTDTKTLTLIGDTDAEAEIIWRSDNEKVATVENGVITINEPGRTVISAYVNGNRSLSDFVTIIVSQGTGAAAATPTPTPSSGRDKNMNIPYLSGYDGMIKPDDYMTRAEAATIMIKLAGEEEGEYENIFPDVREGTWYIDIIAEAAARGFISGFEDGTFRPEETLTREQFAAMVVRLAGIEPVEGQTFDDVEESRWSAASINAAAEKGIISGYVDGSFLPENPIRRSEAVRMANVATGRIPDRELIDTIPCPYTDLPYDHWAYYEFMIASVEFEIPE